MIKLYTSAGRGKRWRFSLSSVLLLILTLNVGIARAQVSAYSFSQSVGTFSPITGGTVLDVATGNTTTTALNSTVYPVTLPFAFNFNGQNHTALNVSTNGFITFGTTAPSTTLTSPISATVAFDGVVSAFGRDLISFYDIAGETGEIRWETVGTAPNREVVIQWKNFRPTNTTVTTSVYSFSFQIRLKESVNTVSTVYTTGSYLVGSTSYSSAINQIGLRGATNTDFNNRYNASTTSFNTSIAGDANGDDQAFNTVNATPGMPTDGLTYTWTPPTCVAPGNATVANILTTSADLTWTASVTPPANGYTVYYSTTNTAPDTTTVLDATNSVTTTNLTAALSGLTQASTYYVWIRTNCSSTDQSAWFPVLDFVTACGPVTSMFEDFDSYPTGSIVPNCWARIVPAASAGAQTITSTTPASGTRNMYQNAGTTSTPVIVVLPEFSNINAGTHWLRFKARATTTGGALEVGYVTDAADAATFMVVSTLLIDNITYTTPDAEYTVIIPSTVPANARIAIRNASDGKSYYWDDVYWEAVPTCLPPSAVSTSNVTTTSVDLSWTASLTPPANGYTVYYSATNSAPDATTVLDVTNSVTTANLTATLSGLNPASTYYVWIRANCSSTDQSNWIGVPSFTTACAPVTNMFEDFDSYATGSIVPQCWARIVPATTPGSQTISSATPASGTRHILQSATSAQTPVTVVLPEFSNIDAGTHWLRFKTKVSTTGGALEVGYVTDAADAATFILLNTLLINNTSYTAADAEYTVIIPTTVPGNARIAIRNASDGKSYYWDDVYWEPVPTCFAPTSLAVTALSVTSSGGVLTWSAPTTSTPTGYELYYSTSNTAPTAATILDGTNSVSVTSTTATLSGLAPSTVYYVWVRSVCSATDKSTWASGSVTLITLCQPPAITGTNVNPTPVCMGGTATLTATADAGATINWYADATTTTPLATGATYTTPVLTATTNYYVSASAETSVLFGKVQPDPSPSSGAGTTNFGLVFDVFTPVTIESVTVYPVSSTGASGTLTIDVIDGSGAIVHTATVNVTGSPSATPLAQVVNLNFQMTPGTNYKMRPGSWTGITQLLFDPAANAPGGSYAYPFVLPGVLSINTSTLTAAPTNTARNDLYYYFYNWQVSGTCESARTMVTATYDSTCALGTSETENGKEISVYPNPFTDVVNISEVKDLKSVTVIDMSGRMVKSISSPGRQINLSELTAGLYILKLDYKDGTVKTVKAIKK